MTNQSLFAQNQKVRQMPDPAPPAPVFRTLAQVAEMGDTSVGGKAYNLAVLSQAGFPVPDAVILSIEPKDTESWQSLSAWWKTLGSPRLAARSSALGEDAKNTSFAGQLSSVLSIETQEELENGVRTCFASKDRLASMAYQARFGQRLSQMNVLVQRQVDPAFSGVYFSVDPRGKNEGWLIEVIEGIGERLVSGEVTPVLFSPFGTIGSASELWKDSHLEAVQSWCQKVEKHFGYPVDIEWAIDSEDRFWLLQSRPITTVKRSTENVIQRELDRLKANHRTTTQWDGQTFVEWTGLPTPLSFSIWEQSFSVAPEGAFTTALREIGYQGFDETKVADGSLLENVFGRACLNLDRLQPLYFGQIPYDLVAKPHAHLEFNWRKIDAPTILHAPSAIFRMMKVAWNVQSHADSLLDRCRSELETLAGANKNSRQINQRLRDRKLVDLVNEFQSSAERFSSESLKWPFVLAILGSSILETLGLVLAKDLGKEKGDSLLRDWMSHDLSTVTFEMDQKYRAACVEQFRQEEFLANFGHRGPGELDLSKPRWIETGAAAFQSSSKKSTPPEASHSVKADIERLIHPIRRAYVEREWELLKSILELREKWKMEVMRSYAELRYLAIGIGQVSGLGDDVFWLGTKELSLLIDSGRGENEATELANEIAGRRDRNEQFSRISLPISFSLVDLTKRINGAEDDDAAAVFAGEALSPGRAFGKVRIVNDPSNVRMDEWPENVILVAEATDPGWTPLFMRASGIVVERGGVLSHCAIVAREMGLPAVSQIIGASRKLKDGQDVWVDGDRGTVTIA
jgi:rifampicin phosphotransferase